MGESNLPHSHCFTLLFFFSFGMKSIKYLNYIAISLAALSIIMILAYLFGISFIPNLFIVIFAIVSISLSFLSTILTMILSFRDEKE